MACLLVKLMSGRRGRAIRPGGYSRQPAVVSGHPFAFQAKATINWELVEGSIVYDLEAKTYDDIVTRDASQVTMLLVLLCLPKDQADWHQATADATMIRNCCHWAILKGDLCGKRIDEADLDSRHAAADA
jgi:hypothetical protein